jgi:hypothetical protein
MLRIAGFAAGDMLTTLGVTTEISPAGFTGVVMNQPP